MTLPDQGWVVQINWSDEDTDPPWSDASVSTFVTREVAIDIERRSFRGSLRSDTCSITLDDIGFDIRPSKASSSLAPNVVLGRRVRVLAQTAPGSGVWHCWFFGYIRDYQPAPNDDCPATTVILADGPLAALAPMQVALSPSIGAVVWDATDPFHTGLWHLLQESGLWGSNILDLEDVGAVTLPDDWAGPNLEGTAFVPANFQQKSFSEWLTILVNQAKTFVADEPQYAVSAGDPDWTLHWYLPTPTATTDFSWSAPNSELEPTPQLSYNGVTSF